MLPQNWHYTEEPNTWGAFRRSKAVSLSLSLSLFMCAAAISFVIRLATKVNLCPPLMAAALFTCLSCPSQKMYLCGLAI